MNSSDSFTDLITNLEIFLMNIYYDFFFNWHSENTHTPSFEPVDKLFSFSTAQTEKNVWKKIRETNW